MCFKIATEVLQLEEAAACLQMQRLVRAHTEHGQEPYIKVAIRVKDMLLAWHRFLVQNTA
jgi:hypothetical protein